MSPTSDKPDELSKPEKHEPGKQKPQERTVGNHPADPNRLGADWNLLPPGISDQDARDPGNMQDTKHGDTAGTKAEQGRPDKPDDDHS